MNIQEKINNISKKILKRCKKVDRLNNEIKMLESHRDDLCDIRDEVKIGQTEFSHGVPIAEFDLSGFSHNTPITEVDLSGFNATEGIGDVDFDKEDWKVGDRLKITEDTFFRNEIVRIISYEIITDGTERYTCKGAWGEIYLTKDEAVKI